MNIQPVILVVDDDPALRSMLARSLRRFGYEVRECVDGVEAFEALENLEGQALLVLDYEMPKFNGAQVCEIIRTHADTEIAQTPIILLTGHTGEDHEIECLKAGADDFVTKPVNLPVLRARIETHLRMAFLRSELVAQNRQAEEWRALHERDLEAARLVQQAILPQKMPQGEVWELAFRYQSLIQVGGDIYDWHRLEGGRVLVWMADATGHGASAALLTTFTKLLFRYAVGETERPDEILRYVNREFRSLFGGQLFLTAACVLLEPTGELSLAGAGHPPLLIVRKGGRLEWIASTAPPIGLTLEAGLPELEKTNLEEGDRALLYSDGLYSVTDARGSRLAFSHFLELLEGMEEGSAQELLEEAIRRVLLCSSNDSFDDDLAVIAMHRGFGG